MGYYAVYFIFSHLDDWNINVEYDAENNQDDKY